jgi:hypothetical protein
MLVYLPMPLFRLLETLPSKSLQGLRNVAIEGNKVAKQLVDQKRKEQANGSNTNTRKDVLSLLGTLLHPCILMLCMNDLISPSEHI